MKSLIKHLCGIATVVALSSATLVHAQAPATDFQVNLLMAGSINDGGFYLQGQQALDTLKKSGVKTGFTELVKMPDAERVIRRYASSGANAVVGHGGAYRATLMKVAPDFPKTSFIALTGGPIKDKPANVWNLQAYYHEVYYLAGAAAALASQTGKVGYVGGLDFPTYIAASKAYEAGAKAINPNIQVMVAFVGSLDDALKARETSKGQLDAGADILAHNLDTGVYGVVEALKGTKGKMIGMGLDQSGLAPGQVLTTVLIDYAGAYVAMAENVRKGTQGGDFIGSFQTDFVRLSPIDLPADRAARVNELGQQIKSGKLKVPEIYAR